MKPFLTFNFLEKKVPLIWQAYTSDCGPACLGMIAQYYGKDVALAQVRDSSNMSKTGVSLEGLCQAAQHLELDALAVRLPLKRGELSLQKAPKPLIIHWESRHFIILEKMGNKSIRVVDPAKGRLTLSEEEFLLGAQKKGGLVDAVIIQPSIRFTKNKGDKKSKLGKIWEKINPHLHQGRILLFSIFLLLCFQLLLPFSVQAIVDLGILSQTPSTLTILLGGFILLNIGLISIQWIQSYFVLFLGNRLEVGLGLAYMQKLSTLSKSFFDARYPGDLLLRFQDNARIQFFVSQAGLKMLYALLSILGFSILLVSLNPVIFFIHLGFSFFIFFWVIRFFRKRRLLDQTDFDLRGEENEYLWEFVRHVPFISRFMYASKYIGGWIQYRERIFENEKEQLVLSNSQEFGAQLLNLVKDSLLLYIGARLVMEDVLSMGGFLAIQFVIGQLDASIRGLPSMLSSYQDAIISADRIQDVQERSSMITFSSSSADFSLKSIQLKGVYFHYEPNQDWILEDINFQLDPNLLYTLVGPSGSGKSTLLKLLARIYEPTQGQLYTDSLTVNEKINIKDWSSQVVLVSHADPIFSDDLESNILMGRVFDLELWTKVIQSSGLKELLDSGQIKRTTPLGNKGYALSHGQRIRILLARGLYCEPQLLLMDEMTEGMSNQLVFEIRTSMRHNFPNMQRIEASHHLPWIKASAQILLWTRVGLWELGAMRNYIKAQLPSGLCSINKVIANIF